LSAPGARDEPGVGPVRLVGRADDLWSIGVPEPTGQ